MAKEYIEREEAIQYFKERSKDFIGHEPIPPALVIMGCANEVDAIPAADVAPVRHGRWLTQEYMYGDKSVGIDDAWIERVAEKGECAYCSNCKEYAKLDGNEESALTPYCPNCGAKMDGGQDYA